ncbi:MAG: TIGR04372 family glycosyltransferase [bacterium]|nr:TIGR04372 family glycosyltransferase [bacterium]
MSYVFYQTKRILKEIKSLLSGTQGNATIEGVNQRLRRFVNKITLRQIIAFRIGHLAFNTEDFLRHFHFYHEEAKKNKHLILLFSVTPEENIVNHQLMTMIKRNYPVIDSPLLLNVIFSLAENDPQLWKADGEPLLSNVLVNIDEFFQAPASLSFTEEEEEKGRRLLKDMGLEEDARFICFHSRDSVYLDKISPDMDWTYHDYRDCQIENFLPAARYLTGQGYYALRMGYGVTKELVTDDPKIIDYATRFRSDFGDIYLSAKCRFFIGNTAGISLITKDMPCHPHRSRIGAAFLRQHIHLLCD